MQINEHKWVIKAMVPITEAEALQSFVEGGLDVAGRTARVESVFCSQCGVTFSDETDGTACGSHHQSHQR